MLTDPPSGTKEFIGATVDSVSTMQTNARRLTQHFPRYKRIALTPGILSMWSYPRPKWVLCIAYPGRSMNAWGFNHWSPVLVYGPDPYLENCKGCRPDTYYQRTQPEPNGHPYPKSLATWKWLLNRISIDPKEIIFDPFLGSGSTLIVAKALGHEAIGIEIEEKYCELAARRLSQESFNFTIKSEEPL